MRSPSRHFDPDYSEKKGTTRGFSPQFPYHMVWLATNACNARCMHCSSDSGGCRPTELSTVEAKSLFDNIAKVGVLDVAVSGGEPLLRLDIFDVLEHAASLGIRLGIGSNGSTVTPAVVERLKALGINRLQISIDGLEETHDTARCWPGLFRKAVNAVRLGLEGGLRVHVCFTVHRMNYLELPKVLDQCVRWGVRRFNVSRFVPTGRGDAGLDLTPNEWRRVVAIGDSKRREYEERIEFTTHLAQMILGDPSLYRHEGFVGCQAGRGQGCVGPEGEVSPCVVLPVVIGNIRESSLEEIWGRSPVIHALQNRSKLNGKCVTCIFREKCGGCRAVAHAYSGDYLEADPRCWL